MYIDDMDLFIEFIKIKEIENFEKDKITIQELVYSLDETYQIDKVRYAKRHHVDDFVISVDSDFSAGRLYYCIFDENNELLDIFDGGFYPEELQNYYAQYIGRMREDKINKIFKD